MARPTVRIFCDFEAEGIWGYPLYLEGQDAYWCEHTGEQLTMHAPDLLILRDLALWNRHYSLNFQCWEEQFYNDVPPCPPSVFDPDAFTAEGLRLAHLLKINHPDWRILFFDEIASQRGAASAQREERSFIYEVELKAEGGLTLLELKS